jgi:hypothetical protein
VVVAGSVVLEPLSKACGRGGTGLRTSEICRSGRKRVEWTSWEEDARIEELLALCAGWRWPDVRCERSVYS